MSTEGPVVREHESRLFGLPATRLGTWSGWLLVVSIVLIVANAALVIPATEAAGMDDVQRIVNVFIFLSTAASGVMGLVALAVRHERSGVAFAAVALLAFALFMNLAELSAQ